MILPVHDRFRARLAAVLQSLYQLPPDALPQLPIEYPPKRELGDLATPAAFELARRLRKAPRAIAQEIAAAFGSVDGIARVEAAPNGYLNVYLDRVAFAREQFVHQDDGRSTIDDRRSTIDDRRSKTIVEHTAINPNKAAHIGHLRNSALGDTLVRVQRFRGVPVEVQNYIDDTGVQVADVVVGFQELERKGLDDIQRIAETTRFDYYCWDLYARVTLWYDEDKERLKIRAAALHDIEHGGTEVVAHRAVHRRPHRPVPSGDDGAVEHRLRPADVGRPHSALAVLGAGVRDSERVGRGVSADRRESSPAAG